MCSPEPIGGAPSNLEDIIMARRRCSTVATVCVILLATSAHADTIHVPADYSTIQDAINAAQNGDEIVVAPGTYYEAIDFLGKNLSLRSVEGPGLTTIDATGLDVSVITMNGFQEDGTLEGFTITGGVGDPAGAPEGGGIRVFASSPTLLDCVFLNNSAVQGGGVYAAFSDLAIVDCVFQGNSANSGAGIHLHSSNPTIDNCIFIDNTAFVSGGGGIFLANSGLWISNSAFDTNTASGGGAGGGGISSHSSVLNVQGSLFIDNLAFGASTFGGAIFSNVSHTLISSCHFTANTSFGQESGGGAVYAIQNIELSLSNSVFLDNMTVAEPNLGGGAILVRDSLASLLNCSFSNNSADLGAAIATSSSQTSIINSITWGDRGSDPISGEATVAYSNIQGGYPGNNNMDTDPMFADTDDLHLLAGSPCVDAGDNSVVDPTAVDVDGGPRIQHCRVDIGAYESPFFMDCNSNDSPDACEVENGTAPDENDNGIPDECECPADFNGDGVVNVPDLIFLLGEWGTNPGSTADFDGDGEVRVPDLLIVLGTWGSCN